MASPTLLNLRTRARQRANMENSTFVTDAEFNTYINYSINTLRDKMISKGAEEYFSTIQSYALIDGQEEYALPADFYKITSVQMQADNTYYYTINRFEYTEQNANIWPLWGRLATIRYRIRGNNLVFNPSTNIGGRLIRLIYVPVPTELAIDAETLNGFNGWDEYPVLLSAIKALKKEEQDTVDLERELAQIEARLDTMTDNRDQSAPSRVHDVKANSRGYWL